MTYIGYAVDNARLFEEARESARRLQRVVDDLKATQEELVRGETLRAMGQLAAGMAHHLNNLFAVILGRTELLMGTTEKPPARRSLEIIRRAAEDGADVARRVQRFGRLHPLSEPVAVDLHQLAVAVVELTEPRRQEEAQLGHRIDVTVEAGTVPPAVGETAPIREVLMNLLLNAMDAMPDGGRATIRTWVEDKWGAVRRHRHRRRHVRRRASPGAATLLHHQGAKEYRARTERRLRRGTALRGNARDRQGS
jgi:signal transduction histidine kinase